jgi:hypothetical protein
MTDLSPETIYRVFRDLLDEAPASLRPEIEALLARAEAGEKTDNQLLLLARPDPDFLQRVNARLEMVGGTRGFSDLPGPFNPDPPSGPTYVCPQCDYTRVLGEVGEDPGECPTHQVTLIPKAQKGR